MKRVVKKDDYGCGIACIAMLAGISYYEARRRLQILSPKNNYEIKPTAYLTGSKQLKKLLIELGVLKSDKRFKSCNDWKKITNKALVAINYNQKTHNWHWVVFDFDKYGPFIFDPSPRTKLNKRRKLNKIRLHNYLELEN